MFNKRRLDSNHASWLLPSHVGMGLGVEVADAVAGRIAVLHISGENHRDFNWENRVRDLVQHVQVANNPNDVNEVAHILVEKLGDTPRGFMVLVRYDLEARTDSISDVTHDRVVCYRGRSNRDDDCTKWVFVLGKT